jgi:hypothetical protein
MVAASINNKFILFYFIFLKFTFAYYFLLIIYYYFYFLILIYYLLVLFIYLFKKNLPWNLDLSQNVKVVMFTYLMPNENISNFH